MEDYDYEEVYNCYNLTAKQYSDAFCNELDGKPFDRDVLRRFSKSVDQSRPIYEFAAGSCHISNFVYQNGLHNIVATDITPDSLKYALIKYPHLKFELMNMLSTGLKDDSINGIICSYGIVHFTYKEVDQVIKEWKRILVQNGIALFCFHIGSGDSLRVENFLENKNAKATWNFFEVDNILEIMKNNGIDYSEVIVRYPYIGNEHPSKRCYIQFEKK